MVQVDRAVIVNVDQRTSLIVPGGRKTDPELHRGQRDALADHPARGVMRVNGRATVRVVAAVCELVGDPVQNVVGDGLVVRRDVATVPVVIGAAHGQRIHPAMKGDLFDDTFRRDHPLRPAKAPERRVRHRICHQRPGSKFNRRVVIRVVGVKQRAVCDRAA